MKFINEEDNFTLLIFEVMPEDAGNYACVAINTVGKATCTARLNIEGSGAVWKCVCHTLKVLLVHIVMFEDKIFSIIIQHKIEVFTLVLLV